VNGELQRSRREEPVLAIEPLFAQGATFWKRAIDVVGAGVVLVALLPLMALVAAAMKVVTPGPLIFKQKRCGLGGKQFVMYKFRTMIADAEKKRDELLLLNEADGPVFKIKDDPRITSLGKILRRTSIDELPQLWNVLKGNMSLVGPRPLPPEEIVLCDRWQRRRLEVTPGITCIWQVTGRSQTSFEDWVRADIRYISRRSLWTDLLLLLKTIPAVLVGKGAM
jgi:lipopolysaccharide/colanic/teichoic acid biosynthesis glycosyltransferase